MPEPFPLAVFRWLDERYDPPPTWLAFALAPVLLLASLLVVAGIQSLI